MGTGSTYCFADPGLREIVLMKLMAMQDCRRFLGFSGATELPRHLESSEWNGGSESAAARKLSKII